MGTHRRCWSAVVSLALLLGACASRPSAGPPADRNVLTMAEIDASGYTDALTVIQSLRPLWLNNRGITSLKQQESVKIYLDGSLMGGPERLAEISSGSIGSMRFLDPMEATNRWGLDHGNGAIMVSTRPKKDDRR